MKTIRTWLAICGLFFLSPEVFAGFTYVTNGSAITVTGYTGPVGAITISNFVTSIGTNAFYENSSLSGVTIPGSVTNIGSNAFEWCSLNSITISNGVKSIGQNAFSACPFSSVTIPASVASIGTNAFAYTSLTSVTIPASITNWGSGAFGNCASLTSVTFANGLASIGNNAFTNCYKLTSVAIPGSVNSIGEQAFYQEGGTSQTMTNVTISNGVTTIGMGAFVGCSMTSVTIPASVTNIGVEAFCCGNLTNIAVNAQNPSYSSLNGVLFNKNQTTLVECPCGIFRFTVGGNYTIPVGVTSIGQGAFDTCPMTSVTVPNTVTSIGEGAFAATSLTSVTIPGNVTSIGQDAFFYCSTLRSVYFNGNAPIADSTGFDATFFEDNNVTAYYLSGTTGWSNTFAGIPAVLWNPPIQTSNDNFGVRTNKFGFTITGPANIPIVVQARTNLTSGVWTNVQSCTITNGSIYFTDPAWMNFRSRFYRVSYPYP